MSLNSYLDHTAGYDIAASGAVSSMYSPAAYLAELYAAAKTLHSSDNTNHLDKRRSDLAELVLSQKNMDRQQSLLSLMNNLLSQQTRKSLNLSNESAVQEMLSTYRLAGSENFHYPYAVVRQSLLQKDPQMNIIADSPVLAQALSPMSLLSLYENISPDLYALLTEDITEENSEDLIKKNFGEIDVQLFLSMSNLVNYYGLDSDSLTFLQGILTPSYCNTTGSVYINGYFTTSAFNANSQMATRVTFNLTPVENPSAFKYIELIPVRGDNYKVNLCPTSTESSHPILRIMFEGDEEYAYTNDDLILISGQHYSFDITIPEDKFSDGLRIGIQRVEPESGGYHFSSCIFYRSTDNLKTYLLKLNKIIRLYKALKLCDVNFLNLSEESEDFMTINAEILSKLGLTLFYRQYYVIPVSQARVLAGGSISRAEINGQISEFTELFTLTDSDGNNFSADGTALDLTPGGSGDTFRIAALCQAFGVNSTELQTLWLMTRLEDSTDFTCSMDNLSALYRVALLARVHGLSVSGLQRLLSVTGLSARPGSLASDDLATLVITLRDLTGWLADSNLSADALNLMLSDQYGTTLTPDAENLLTTLQNNLAEPGLSGDALLTALAPLVAAEMQLESADMGAAILLWFNQHPPALFVTGTGENTALDTFWQTVCKADRTPDDTALLAAGVQRISQFSLQALTLGLFADELALFVRSPEKLRTGLTTLVPEAETVHQLSCFHHWLQQCGTSAAEAFTSLAEGILTPAALAGMTGQNEQMVQQAAALVTQNTGLLTGWTEIDAVMQVMAISTVLGITPGDLQKLLVLDYINSEENITFDDWQVASHTLMSALDANQTLKVTAALEEEYCMALSGWYIAHLAPRTVTNRNDLYDWLLLDPLTGGRIMTTPVAAAISSLQLYVNRVLNGVEDNVDYTAQTSAFFTRWNMFNKSYSTWAGGKKLAYYAENYVDPTVRLGQTGMMSDMLQTLSQSELSEDTVAAAFNTYMTDFEKVANLSVICAYHDGEDLRKGLTWFIGQSPTNKGDFYWRTLDQAQLTEGKYPANAWSEWVKIDMAITPYNGLIKPVVFNSRLYLLWVEEHKESTTGENNTVISTSVYKLKWSWKLHDGSWATPQEKVENNDSINENTRLYCGYDNHNGFICYSLYKAGLASTDADSFPVYIINSDNSVSEFKDSSVKKQDDSGYNGQLLTLVYEQLDTAASNISNVARHVHQDNKITASSEIEKGYGSTAFSYLTNGELSNISVSNEGSSKKTITFDISAVSEISNNIKNDDSGWAVILSKAVSLGLLSVDGIYKYTEIKDIPSSFTFAEVGGKHLAWSGFEKSNNKHLLANINPHEFFNNTDKYADKNLGDLFKCLTIKKSEVVMLEDIMPDSKHIISPETSMDSDVWQLIQDNTPISELSASQLLNVREFLNYYMRTITLDYKYQTLNLNLSTTYISANLEHGSWGASMPIALNDVIVYPDLMYGKQTINAKGSITMLNSVYEGLFNSGQEKHVTFTTFCIGSEGHSSGFQKFKINFNKAYKQYPVTLHHETSGVQYMEAPPYRTRLNTLFAHSLVSKAAKGLDAVLSMDTQTMQEPKMGNGTYVTLTLGAYNQAVHGDSTAFSIHQSKIMTDKDEDQYTVYSGELSKFGDTVVTLFMPDLEHSRYGNAMDHFDLSAVYQSGQTNAVSLIPDPKNEGEWILDKVWNSGTFAGLKAVTGLSATTEAMDFSGSSALYFWEMFYYVPMMVFQRMLDEQRYDDARTWLNYIWNPGGYIYKGNVASWQWNMRPLEEDTSWNSSMPDTYDPDAVAQADPMHYKAATVMKLLDLLIARGDSQYRQLTTDALGEAKMWYGQAQHILGTRDLMLPSADGWIDEKLSEVAGAESSPFLPEQNEQIDVYLQTLTQRLYNLRHNLSIDGQPLHLSVYSTPADPKALQCAAVAAAGGGSELPVVDFIPQYRFPVMLQDARSMTGQLSQFGNTLLNVAERQDAEAMAELLQTQGSELALQSIAMQQKTIDEIDADALALEETRKGTQVRLDSYQALYDENISANEQRVMDLNVSAASTAIGANILLGTAGGLDMAPNVFGLADGGSQWGAATRAAALILQNIADVERMKSDKIAQSESYRRRRQEWAIQRDIAQHELAQITAQQNSLSIRRQGAVLQKSYLETQQKHVQAQMSFLKSKFSNKALYSWMKGKLASLYYTFYDLTVSRCLMAEKAYRYDTGENDTLFIRAGAWQGAYGGLLAGETLMLALAQMEAAYLKQDTRALEVTKTVSLAQYYSGLGDNAFTFHESAGNIISAGSGSAGTAENGLSVQDGALNVTVKLSDLGMLDDYPAGLGSLRRLKQVSVTLPALLGPYEDVRAVLSYGGSITMPKGCNAVAISHGMHDSGQFQLNFEDSRYLPFEGIPVDDSGTLTLSFPDMGKGQKDLLNSLNDVILHIAYTIR